ncbi:MAG: response regulator [Bacteroidales bacterium]|nr:response regulator [Bacteroidales bacterium]
MDRKHLFILAAALLLIGGAAAAQPYQFRKLDAASGLPDNNVRDLQMLPDGLMCIQTASYLCFYNGAVCWNYRWDPLEVPYTEYSGVGGLDYDATARQILLRTRDHAWAFDRDRECFVYGGQVPASDTVAARPAGMMPEAMASRSETAVSSDGTRWFLSDKHIVRYQPSDGQVVELERIPSGSDDLFTTFAVDRNDNLWVGTARSGIRILYRDGRREQLPYLQCTDGKRIYPHTDITRIYADPKGGIWIATQQEGILYWHPDIIQVRTVNAGTLDGGSMPDEGVKCLAEAPDGKVLVGTVRGLLLYDPATNRMSIPYRELEDELVISLSVDSAGRIWAGTFYNGVYSIDGGRIRHYTYPEQANVDVSYQTASPNLNCVRFVKEGPDGRFWISVYGGLGRFNPDSGAIELLRESHSELSRYMVVRDMVFDAAGCIEAAGDNGRFRYDPASDRVIPMDPVPACTLTNQLHLDSEGRLWAAESGGLEACMAQEPCLRITDVGTVMSILEDRSGVLWASSISDILRIGDTGEASGATVSARFGTQDGVECGAFFQTSALRHSDGHLYFGGASGFCILDPDALALSGEGMPPYISSLKVGGESRPVSPSLVLGHKESSVSFAFTNLNYANPAHSTYRYRLDGFEKDWHYIASAPLGEAGYTFLKPGKYTFTVAASCNGTDWSDPVQVPIEVKPPFWKTGLAFALYALLVLGLAGLAIYWFLRREANRMQRQAETEKREREEELNQMKFRFFTNISHELRTPLSLIILPLESLMKEKEGTGEYGRLETMHRNAKSLLDLVNHLLDFRKVEMGGEKLQLRQGNIREFAENLLEAFRPAAAERNIDLSLEDRSTNPHMLFDSNMMQKVINNLISNALKFTEPGGSVTLRLSGPSEGMMGIEVADTGIGIPAEDLPHIFDRFYRSEKVANSTGTGIGLSLVKQYVDLHGGKVTVTSAEGKGSTFSILIPVSGAGNPDISEEEAEPAGDGRKRILVVDDNADFRKYLLDELSGTYAVADACDGEDALQKLPAFRPDIVVSDVMMPKVDGFALIRQIKENVETSHIPVILLTARLSEDVRTEGYEYGADAYLTKPFRMEMLQARIRNLLEEREKRIRSFSSGAEVSPMHVTITTVDQKLMARIMESLESNMDNPDYSVEQMASDVGMHRMNLYRKIQSLYGMTPSEFIRTMRLKRAAQLLTDDPNLNVSEVADMVGFNTVKYFTKYFKELFGVQPSQYKKK